MARPVTDLAEIALTHQQFLQRLPAAARAVGQADRSQADYALTRLVAKNCAAVDDHEDQPTDLVVKGGFAIRHLYSGVRYSKDVDLSMANDELELEGPQLMAWPSDMTHQVRVGQGMASWILSIRFRATNGRQLSTQCDLNDRSRAIRQRPPQRRLLHSLYLESFPVWAATTEEIIGEKLFALIDHGAIRIKDVFDLRHVLSMADEPIDAPVTREVYAACRQTKGNKGPDVKDVVPAIEAIAGTARANQQWQADVMDFVDGAPPLAQATDEMLALLEARLL